MNEQDKHWLVRKTTIRKLWIGLYISLAITVLLELLVEHHERFNAHGIDTTFGFSAWYGFVGCFLMVIFAKLLGLFIKRPDNYYQDTKQDSNRKGQHD